MKRWALRWGSWLTTAFIALSGCQQLGNHYGVGSLASSNSSIQAGSKNPNIPQNQGSPGFTCMPGFILSNGACLPITTHPSPIPAPANPSQPSSPVFPSPVPTPTPTTPEQVAGPSTGTSCSLKGQGLIDSGVDTNLPPSFAYGTNQGQACQAACGAKGAASWSVFDGYYCHCGTGPAVAVTDPLSNSAQYIGGNCVGNVAAPTSCPPGQSLFNGSCYADIQHCTSGANAEGFQYFDSSTGTYGACQFGMCNDGFHNAGTSINPSCVSNTQSCSLVGGTGVQTWGNNQWGPCQAAACKPGFTLENGVCINPNGPCGTPPAPTTASLNNWKDFLGGTFATGVVNQNEPYYLAVLPNDTRSVSAWSGPLPAGVPSPAAGTPDRVIVAQTLDFLRQKAISDYETELKNGVPGSSIFSFQQGNFVKDITPELQPGQAVNLGYIGNPTPAQLNAYLTLTGYSAAQTQALTSYPETATASNTTTPIYQGTRDGLILVNAKQVAESNMGQGWNGFGSYSGMTPQMQVTQRYMDFAGVNIVYTGDSGPTGSALDPTQMLGLTPAQKAAGYSIYWDQMTHVPVAMTTAQYQQYMNQLGNVTTMAGLLSGGVPAVFPVYDVDAGLAAPAFWTPTNFSKVVTTWQSRGLSQAAIKIKLQNALTETGYGSAQIQAMLDAYQNPKAPTDFSGVPTTDAHGNVLQMNSIIWIMPQMGYSNQQIANYLWQNGCSADVIQSSVGVAPQR